MRMTWAEKARGRPLVGHRSDDDDNSDRPNMNAVIDVKANKTDGGDGVVQKNVFWVPPQNFPGDVWDVIFSFLNFREVQLVGSTCRYLWLLLRKRDNIWRLQLQYFHRDMEDLRGDGKLLLTEFLLPLSSSAYDRMRLEHKLYALDARREWHFKEQERFRGHGRVFSFPLTLVDDYHDYGEGNGDNARWGDGETNSLLQIRLLRPVSRRTTENLSSTVGGNGSTNIIYTPSEYLTLCDNINHGDLTGSRTVVQECTASEDGLLLFALQQTLRRVKRRTPRRLSANEPRTCHHLMLRHFSGQLLVICRFEAEQILQSILGLHGTLDDFVIYSNPSRLGPHVHDGSASLPHTRYFIAPELCRHGRVGLFVVDPVRVLIIVGKEHDTSDDQRWDDEYREAAEEGRAVPGSGMNPQQPRRV